MKRLERDERGAIMVAALFMAIFATGCLHYVVQIAAAIEQRERMQDAADAAAFSSAVMHARGMNVIALINMTMAALLAVLISLRVVQMLAGVGVAFATSLAFVTGGVSLGAVPLFTEAGILATQAYEQAQPVVQGTLRALRIAARGVRVAIPWVAQAQTATSVVKHYGPIATFGFAVPGQLTLPTRDGTYMDLCLKSGEYVGDLIDIGLGPVSEFGFSVGDITGGLIDMGSAWFCGAEDGSPPSVALTRKDILPKLPLTRECEAMGNAANADSFNKERHTALCDEAKRQTERADAAIDWATGACLEDCGPDGLYELRSRLALESCAPREKDAALVRFWYQTRVFKRRYIWIDDTWQVEEATVPGSEVYRRRKDMARPCGVEGQGIGPQWRTGQAEDGTPLPVCDDIAPPEGKPYRHGDEYTLDVSHTEVLRVFRCQENIREQRTVDTGAGDLAAKKKGDDDSMAPQLIEKDAVLGEDPFQLRSFVFGSSAAGAPDAILGQLNSPEKDENEEADAWDLVRELRRLSVAQAEFYFDKADAPPDSYLWAMSWSARLRPFRLTDSEPSKRKANDDADALLHGIEGVFGSFEDACLALPRPKEISCDVDLDTIKTLIEH